MKNSQMIISRFCSQILKSKPKLDLIVKSFVVVIIFSSFSCSKDKVRCAEMTTTYKYLTPVSLERTRYFTDPTFDTIKFKSNKGDTLIFVKTDCDTNWFDDFISYNDPACGPYANNKYQQITNYYKTIKGEGSFEVKHSLRAKLTIDLNPQDYVLEIKFLGNHFYFFEEVFNDKFYEHYIGSIMIDDKIYPNSFLEYANFDIKSKVIGVMAPQFGLITVQDSLHGDYFQFLK